MIIASDLTGLRAIPLRHECRAERHCMRLWMSDEKPVGDIVHCNAINSQNRRKKLFL